MFSPNFTERQVFLLITITKEEFRTLANYIQKNYGIALREEKQALVKGRLQSVLTSLNIKSFSEYYDYVLSDQTGEAAVTLLNRITTNHTFFMREPDHFYFFRDTVLPQLRDTVKSKDLRIWSAGCSSGEEPYTLAMLTNEFFGPEKKWWDTKILATDISNQVLEEARQGIYSTSDLQPLPAPWLGKHFHKLDAQRSQVSDALRNEVIFRRFNLMNETFSFQKNFHVIFCRNVMIYFNSDTRQKLVERFYNATAPGGYLFIGHAESLPRESTKYQFVQPAVYRKES